ncbi:MAG: tripartite tricarboxylate transporter substrate binding protein [Betaproteobacteria bacterium]|nr:tripartite tricarboxylate transporter substrate binding protein [Betaproteobacteria bacterium]
MNTRPIKRSPGAIPHLLAAQFVKVLVCMVTAAFISGAAQAQSYPTKPIRMVVPFAPGGTGDFLSRSITARMGELMGQQFIIDFRPGAGTTLAAALVASAPADGYTVLIQSFTTQAINQSLYQKLTYDTRRDFAPAGLIAVIPVVLAAHPSLPARNVKELVALSHARRGKIDFASPGIGTASHFGVELFKLVSKADLTHIPYKGAGPAIVDAMAGLVPLVTDHITSLTPHIAAGKLRGLAIGRAQRSEAAPQWPTFAESGYPDFEASSWWGLLAPARTPPAVITRLNAEMKRALEDAAVRNRLLSHGATIRYGTPAQSAELLASELEKWAKVVKATGARVD